MLHQLKHSAYAVKVWDNNSMCMKIPDDKNYNVSVISYLLNLKEIV